MGPLTTEETVQNVLRYAGEYWGDTVGLQYLRARWYDPSMARFIGEDTYEGELTNPLSQNLYTYVENNPLIYSDPGGNFKIRSADFLALESFGITVGDYVQGKKLGEYDYERAKDRKALTAAERYVVDMLRHGERCLFKPCEGRFKTI
ncbi:RHS repeat-associated core domain-containing protein [Paenibacillus xylanilyticus]|uniref:RHS repeat-associated core domain-containing protein n=1 Tax=Paenibacillus xylanilyticus TaxID=248903 RepID=UPI0021ABCEF2